MDGWVKENMENIMLVIEIVGVSMVAAIFVLYFVVKRKLSNKNDK